LNLLDGRWRKGRLWLKCLYDSPNFGCLPELQRLLDLQLSLIDRVKYVCQIANASSISLSASCCVPVNNGNQTARGVTNRDSVLGVGLFKMGLSHILSGMTFKVVFVSILCVVPFKVVFVSLLCKVPFKVVFVSLLCGTV
jgi:hypothetical protein